MSTAYQGMGDYEIISKVTRHIIGKSARKKAKNQVFTGVWTNINIM